MHRLTLLVPCLCLFLFVGCSQKPPELSNLFPVTITVKNGDTSMAGVHVSLTTDAVRDVWGSSGMTDSSGVARIESTLRSHVATGVSPGTYKIVLTKSVDLPPELQSSPDEEDAGMETPELIAKRKKRDKYIAENRIIPEKYSSSSTTPLTVTVEPKTGANATVDISQ